MADYGQTYPWGERLGAHEPKAVGVAVVDPQAENQVVEFLAQLRE